MRIHTDLAAFSGVKRPVLTTGTFDGVHLGHRTILARLTELARKEGGESVLFTFHPHPRMVLFPGDDGLKLLNTQDEKMERLAEAGLDHVLMVPFSRTFSRMHAVDYVREVLVGAIGVHAIVIGYDHRFGRNREGDLGLLKQLGEVHGIRVEEIPAHEVDRMKVSSTKVRHALLAGEVAQARELLGYPYPLTGVVVKGDQVGRTIGYPTANIGAVDTDKLIPADGVYAVQVHLVDGQHQGMLYIGERPTLGGGLQRTIEVNVFDLARDLYGERITVFFMERIRGDIRFEDLDALKRQLHEDKVLTLKKLGARA